MGVAKTIFVSSVSVFAVNIATASYAQSATQPTDEQATASTQSAPAAGDATAASASAQPQADTGIADIVVTATRREERLQQVPVSVTAVTGSSLAAANINTSDNLVQTIPSLSLPRNTSTATPAIRGVVSNGVSAGDETNVAFYIDGVYQPVSTSNIFDLLAVDRVEVLRGPQGTLFGRNAMGGLINVITRDPTFAPEGEASLTVGRFNEVEGRFYASTGLTDNLAFNISALASRADGFNDDLLRGGHVGRQRALEARGKLLWQIAPNFRAIASLAYTYNRDDSLASPQPADGNTQGLQTDPNTIVPTRPNQYAGEGDPEFWTRQWEANLLTQADFGDITLNTATSYEHDNLFQRQDNDASPVFLRVSQQNQPSNAFSQEVRLSGTTARLKWILGAYYYNFSGGNDPILIFTPTSTTKLQPHITAESEALFAEGTYDITDRLSLTAGARYTWEHRTFSQTANDIFLFDTGVNYQNFTPRGILQYKIDNHTNIYASVSRGFKSGVYSATSTTPIPARPETLTAYEVGIKSDPLRWLRANLSVYDYSYQDVQVTSRTPDGLVLLSNAAQARIYGGEIELTAQATHDLNFRLTGSYIHGRYTSFPGAPLLVPRPGGGNTQIFADVSGNQLIRSPQFSGTFSVNYSHEFSSGTLGLNANLFHSSRVYFDVGNRVSQDPYSVLNASISWTLADHKTTFSLWGTNLFNEHYLYSINAQATADLAYYQRPISYGVTVSRHF